MKTIGICASGPSLTIVDCEKVRKHCDEVIAVNDTWRMVRADHLYAADQHWWVHHIHDINMGFSGKRYSCDPPGNTNWGKRDPKEWGVTVFDALISANGLSRDPGAVVTGGNSGYQAIGLARHLLGDEGGRIILLGFDMCWTNGKSHWFGDHPKGLNNAEPNRYVAAYRTIKPEEYNLEIINCSRTTALDAFPIHNLDDIFKD